MMGVVDFELFPGGLCTFTYFFVYEFCSHCPSGDSHAGPLIENPRYSVVNKGKDRDFQRSKWPLVSANVASVTLPSLTTTQLQLTTQLSHARMSE